MSRKRSISSTVCAVVEDERLEQYLSRVRKYLCVYCSHAKIREVVVRGDHLRILDTEKVPYVVVYKVKCPERSKPALYDRISTCYVGDMKQDQERHTCASCKYAEEVIVETKPVQVNQYKATYNCYRRLYKCTNSKRMEHFTNDVCMAAYIGCQHYEDRGK